jgi:site-specific DNA recombinase
LKHHSDKVQRRTTPDEQEEITVPALVSAELFRAVAERLDDNRRRFREQKKGAEYLLSGLLVCAQCGSAFCGRRYLPKSAKTYTYYHCLGTDRARHDGDRICTNKGVPGRIEEAVWSDVCELLREPQRLRREFEERLDRPAQQDGELTRLEQTIQQHKRRVARLIDAYENGWLDKTDFEPRIRGAKERLARDEAALQERQRESLNREELRLVIGQFDAFASQMSEHLDQADFATKRQLLRLLIKRIDVTKDDVRIVYKVSLPPFVPSPNKRGILQHCLKSLPSPSVAVSGWSRSRTRGFASV